MGLKTALYDTHLRSGAKIVDFGGWEMPLHYGSQIEEHHAVRRDAGMFDVSHMGVVDLRGERGREYLANLLANDVGRLKTPGKALYSCMLLPSGGVIDDLIVYFLSDTWFRLVVNAGTRDKDLAWIRRHAAAFGVTDYVGKLATLHYGAVTAREPRSEDDQNACRKLGQRLAEWVATFVDGRREQHPCVKTEPRLSPS